MSGSLHPKRFPYQPGRHYPLTAADLNKLQALSARTVRGGPGVVVQDFGDRTAVSLNNPQGTLPSVRNYLQQFVILQEFPDYLVCVPWVPYNDGSQLWDQIFDPSLGLDQVATVWVAKPYYLQQTPWNGMTLADYGGTYLVSYDRHYPGVNPFGIGKRCIVPCTLSTGPAAGSIGVNPMDTYRFECWGGGAGGNSITGNGGEGAGYAGIIWNDPVLTSINFSIGAGGAPDTAGGDTWIVSAGTALATGGDSLSGPVGDTLEIGGSGGIGTVHLGAGGGGSGLVFLSGFNGGDAQDSNGTTIPLNGEGGMGQGAGGTGGNTAGGNGAVPGGGGGGRSLIVRAGKGGNGQIRSSLYDPETGYIANQSILPEYQVGELILACMTVTGLYRPPIAPSKAPLPVVWMDINTCGRCWASSPASQVIVTDVYCDQTTNELVVTKMIIKGSFSVINP